MTGSTKVREAPHRRAVLAAAMLAATLGAAGCVHAQERGGAAPVGLTVIDRETGAALPFWRRRGQPFVAGDPGRRYGLRISNRTGGRVLVVMSVDGVNIFTGETAGYDQKGYVLSPYETYDVNGWRKSLSEVAAFTFAPLPLSYAARTGRPGDVGVIGMAVFRERAPAPIPDDEAAEASSPSRRGSGPARAKAGPPPPLPLPPVAVPAPPALARAAPSIAGSSPPVQEGRSFDRPVLRPDQRLGTGHGARESSSIVMVDFERATSAPQSVRRIEYDTAPHLLARGVTPPYAAGRPPRPFPREPGPSGFVPDPPGGR